MKVENINELKNLVSISRVIENFVILHKQGHLFKGLCPFHNENTPSFVVNDKMGIFKCFGCGESGDVISFIQKIKNYDFKEAVAELARLENIELVLNKNVNNFKLYYGFLKDLNAYFKANLLKNDEALNYLLKRGFDEKDIHSFSLGYTGSFEELLRFLKAKDYMKIALDLAYIKKQDSRHYSIFVNRLSFACFDNASKIVGFAARLIKNEENRAKYVNSSLSKIYNKSFLLYNFNTALSTALKENKLYICEGYFDVLAGVKLGLLNIVGTCGTAFTKAHLTLIIKKLSSSCSLCFFIDKDEAGLRAMSKNIMLCFMNGFYNVDVYIFKGSFKDIAAFYEKNKSLNLENDVKIYKGFDFYLKYNLKNCQNFTQKDIFLKQVKNIIINIKDFYAKDELIKIASENFNIEKEYFYTQKITKNNFLNQTKADEKILKICLKTAIEYEDFRELFCFYCNNENIFKSFAKSWNYFLQTRSIDENLKNLLCDESINFIPKSKYKIYITELLKQNIQEQIKQAKINNDLALIMKLTRSLRN